MEGRVAGPVVLAWSISALRRCCAPGGVGPIPKWVMTRLSEAPDRGCSITVLAKVQRPEMVLGWKTC